MELGFTKSSSGNSESPPKLHIKLQKIKSRGLPKEGWNSGNQIDAVLISILARFLVGKKKRSGLRGTGMEKWETERKRGEMKARPIFRNEQGFRNNGPGRRGFL